MNLYKVTMTCDRNQLIRFIDLVGLDNATVEVMPDGNVSSAPAPVQRSPRGSRVIDTIIAALQIGQQNIKDLKQALGAAGLAAGSLSTGLAILQKQGQVERVGDGMYALKMAKAAE